MSLSKTGGDPRPFAFPVFERTEAELRKKAYEEGFQKGYSEGLSQAKGRMEEALGRLEAILRELEDFRRRAFGRAEEEILELAIAVAKKVLRRELMSDRQWVLRTLKEAIEKVTEGDTVKIYLSPDDIDLVKEHQGELLEGVKGPRGVVLHADPGITPGGCFIETEFGHIDARLESQLEAIAQGLKGENGS